MKDIHAAPADDGETGNPGIRLGKGTGRDKRWAVPRGPCLVTRGLMTRAFLLAIAVALLAEPAVVPASTEGFPFTNETLHYTVNFASGIPLGEVQTIAKRDPLRGWTFNFSLDASLPSFPMLDRFNAYAGLDLCSIRYERSSEHGARKAKELTYFDRGRSVAVRSTKDGGGLSEISVGLCPHDALSFLYYLRRELGQGKMPPNDTILAGGAYRVSMVYAGEKSIVRYKQTVLTDQVNCTVKGPASETHLEILFARDAARTPLVVRCPFSMGTFSLELVR
jgi:hypothetical protein